MPERNRVAWNTMLAANAQEGDVESVELLLSRMPEWDLVSWTALVVALAHRGELDHARIVSKRVSDLDLRLSNAIMAASALDHGERVFQSMLHRDISSWNSMLSAYARSGRIDEARWIFDSMPQHDVVSWNALLAAYAQAGDLDHAAKIFSWAMPERDLVSWTAMAAAYAHAGFPDRASAIFDAMPERNRVSWGVALAAQAQRGAAREAVEIFQRMQAEGIGADEISFDCLLLGSSHAGRLREGCHYFRSMGLDFGMAPSKQHFQCVDRVLFSKASRTVAADMWILFSQGGRVMDWWSEDLSPKAEDVHMEGHIIMDRGAKLNPLLAYLLEEQTMALLNCARELVIECESNCCFGSS
ncbi:hypothetical protein SELMODRAFT_442983 [Selaginella moellendorffii]|uniref:Pentacotripeptide-repeat region of PRORP domain-containing protein n=1 Tax=Selaginella moellendorffii TaxID=88036 RepID=D8RYL4_SELML|nr:hypothetical protein SELMODRAFT_442983 [Selaginella moellendorffii]